MITTPPLASMVRAMEEEGSNRSEEKRRGVTGSGVEVGARPRLTHSPAAWLERLALRFFPYTLDIDAELRKLDIARILAGIFSFIRYYQIVGASVLIYGWSGSHASLAIATLVSAVLLTVGLFTPFAAASLAILMRLSDNTYNTGTLGTTVLIQLLIVFVLLRAGRNYSLDSLAISKSKWLQRIYAMPTSHEMKTAYAFAVVVYGTISAAALWFHVRDPYWIHGLTVKSMFTNSYLCKHWDFFRAFDSSYPALLGVISIASGIAQSIFQFLMLPLIAFKYGRIFVRWHGLAFFLISLLFLNLSFLPHYELLLWWVVLFPRKTTQAQPDTWNGKPSPGTLAIGFYAVYFVLVIAFFFTIHWLTFSNEDQGVPSVIRQEAIYVDRAFGIEVPIVFDSADLRMGNRWALLYRDNVLTPLTGADGQRGNYLGRDVMWAGNHNTDLLYFGTTLRYRRRMIDMTDKQLENLFDSGFGSELIQREIAYDYRYQHLSGAVSYKLVVLENQASDVKLFDQSDERLLAHAILTRSYQYDGGLISSGVNSVSADQLASDYTADGAAADKKYKNRILEITGEVAETGTFNGAPYVKFHTGAHQFEERVDCIFNPHSASDVQSLYAGQTVTVRGRCDGGWVTVIVRDSEIKR